MTSDTPMTMTTVSMSNVTVSTVSSSAALVMVDDDDDGEGSSSTSPPENYQHSSSVTRTTTTTTTTPSSRKKREAVRFEVLAMENGHSEDGKGGGLGRLDRPRMSLLGKPLNYRASRRDARYRRLQSRVYNFLERPRGFPAILYHMLVFCMVFMCLALSVFSTIDKYEKFAGIVLFYMETVVVIWFAIEFLLRLWSSGCRSRYQGTMGRLKFLRRPFCIIDVITIIASLIVLVVLGLGSNGQVFAASALRGLRFFQILRMVRMDRRGGTWKLLGSVVYAHRQELITTLYIGFLGLIFSSFLVYLAEKDQNKKHFSNFADALWWGVITLCTVGYGDAVPVTWEGKLIASFCALLGISFFALPAGILGSGFALKVQQQQRQKHMIRRRQPAATLIQSLWRCYAADEHSVSVATWKIHQVPLSPPSFKHNASFVSRLPTIRRHKSTSFHHSPSSLTKGSSGGGGSASAGGNPGSGGGSGTGAGARFAEMNASSENLGGGHSKPINASHSEDSVTETALSNKKNSDDEDEEPRCVQLTNQHKVAIRAIRKLKYFVARKKFREALKPYDVKDVIEQYSSGHADLLNRTKNLQFRLDQILGKQGSKAKDVYASKISLASRIVKVERQVDDIEIKLDQLIEIYMEDRKRFAALPAVSSLPMQPQVSSWSSSSSTTGIIVSMTTTGVTANTATITTTTASLSGEGIDCPGVGGCFRPKPILVDKQSSEPNTPTVRCFDGTTTTTTSSSLSTATMESSRPHRPVCRGHSDLGQRMKKRVTLNSMPSQSLGTPPLGGRDVVILVPGDGESSASPVTDPNWPADYMDHQFSNNDEDEDEEMDEEEEIEEIFTDGEIQNSTIDVEIDDVDEEEDEEEEDDDDDDGEATALLHAAAAATKIVVTTPMSPGASCLDLPVATSICETSPHQQLNSQQQQQQQQQQQSPQMDLLRPDHHSSVNQEP